MQAVYGYLLKQNFKWELVALPRSAPQNISGRGYCMPLMGTSTPISEQTWTFFKWTMQPANAQRFPMTAHYAISPVLNASGAAKKAFQDQVGVDPTAYELMAQDSHVSAYVPGSASGMDKVGTAARAGGTGERYDLAGNTPPGWAEEGQMSKSWTGYAGIGGIISVALIIASSVVSPLIFGNQPAQSVLGSLQSQRTRHLVGVDLQFGAAFVFVLYLTGVYQCLRRSAERWAWMPATALATGVVGVTTVLICQSVLGTLVSYVISSAPAETVKAMYAVFAGIYQASDIPTALFLLTCAVGALGGGAFPRWMGWAAILGAIGLALGAYSYAVPNSALGIIDLIGLLFFLIFIVASSIMMLRNTPVSS